MAGFNTSLFGNALFGGGISTGGPGTVPLSTILNSALRLAGIKMLPGGSASPDAFEELIPALNRMLGGRNCQSLNIFHNSRTVYPLVAGKGGPDNPYTIGPGGDWNQRRPQKIVVATILIDGGPVRMDPMTVTTDPADWASIALQEIAAAIPLALFYDRANPLTNVFLYPQDTGADSIEIYSWLALSTSFSASSDFVDLPDGYYDAITKGLGVEAADLYPVESIKKTNYAGYLALQRAAAKAWGVVQSLNQITPTLQTDAPGASRGTHFDWRIGMNR